MAKQADGRSTVYQGSDGRWHGRVSVGMGEDGLPVRRHVASKVKARVIERVIELEKSRDSQTFENLAVSWTVEQWLEHWLTNIVAPFSKAGTVDGYRVSINYHLVPSIGKHKLAKLRTEHLEQLYLSMMKTPMKDGRQRRPATANQVHRTIRAALNEAVRRGYLDKNPALAARTPRVDLLKVEPYDVEEVQLLLAAAAELRNGTRWVIALALGLRQGEALGLRWDDVDFRSQTLTIERSRLRPRYEHGCRPPCGRKYAGYCPQRIPIRPPTDTTKTSSGERPVGLPDELCALLRAHRTAQNAERLRAGQLWNEGGWLFADEVGNPINPRTDWSRWKQLLVTAGVRDARLHDARHTAATMLLLLGVNDRAIMALMGWTNPEMAKRYVHVVESIRRDVAGRIDGLLWSTDPKENAR